VTLIAARARTSEVQPSLAYIRESAQAMSTATSFRHHLIFGRRGTGKTALMLEARRVVAKKNCVSLWFNTQTYRRENADKTFAWIGHQLCELVLGTFQAKPVVPHVVASATKLREELENFTSAVSNPPQSADVFIPRLHAVLRRFIESNLSPVSFSWTIFTTQRVQSSREYWICSTP
jgi:hypothetical protein